MSGERGRSVGPDYVAALHWAADVVHAEARWQTELAMRRGGRHNYAAERMGKLVHVLRTAAELAAPPDDKTAEESQ